MARRLADIRSLARVHTTMAINTLVAIAKQKKAPANARVTACGILLDRGWGKPNQPVTNEHGISPMMIELMRAIGRGDLADEGERKLLELEATPVEEAEPNADRLETPE